ncbi:putative germin-like protein 2-1 [Cucurbita moschata]|uniref:Germin-like protein n=1 Tax=Cucurbita moschata TaxID=3662 RepID=A0A6J1ELU4_CUCMO|nr:putative germin-like protein 2-1 [Cucurbita moschata]
MAAPLFFLTFLAITCSVAWASDPTPLQDFCVADLNSPVKVNGLVCKDPKHVEPKDFFGSGLSVAADVNNSAGSQATPVGVAQIPGLNTLGISLVRFDFAPHGIIAPHTHPRATEILTVLEGTVLAGFVTSIPDNRLITKTLNKGDVFVFPVGLIHFLQNVGKGHAVGLAALNSQNPGVIPIANSVFGSHPDIPTDILAKAFQTDAAIIANIQAKF